MNKKLYILVVAAMSFGLIGCAGAESTETATSQAVTTEVSEEAGTTTESEEATGDFSYTLSTETLNEDGITATYPVFVETNDQEKADKLNDLILADVNDYIEKMTEAASEAGDLTITMSCEFQELNSSFVSIKYLGDYSGTEMAYPVSFYHSLMLDFEAVEQVSLSDLFTIDENFVSTFLDGNYTPYTEDLNLEDSGVDVAEAITSMYSDSDLLPLFSDKNASFYINQQNLELSVAVQNAIGDHIEMSIPIEWIEGNSNREHAFWENYGFLDGNEGEEMTETESDETVASGVTMKDYSNLEYGFTQSYPDVFDTMEESDDGSGITMLSDSEGYSLLIWAEYNVNGDDGLSLMDEAAGSYEKVSDYRGDANGYKVVFQEGANEDTREGIEKCYVDKDIEVYYILSYPIDAADQFNGVTDLMDKGLILN